MSVVALSAAFTSAVVVTTSTASAATGSPVVAEEAAIARAEVALRTQRAALAATEDDEFHLVRTIVDPDGASHVRYTRTYRGLPVYGGDIVVHNRPDGGYADSSVGLAAPLRLDVTPVIDKKDAAATAIRTFTGTIDSVTEPVLVIDAADGFGRLAYETVISGVAPDKETPSVLHVLVDATKGEVIRSNDEVESIVFVPFDGTGNTYYSGTVTLRATYWERLGPDYMLVDQEASASTCDMGNGTTACSQPFFDEDGTWGDGTLANRQTAAADVHYGAMTAFDYFKNVLGRTGILGDGNLGPSRVHFGDQHSNAHWVPGRGMTYGDGYMNQYPYVSLDVVGHEMTHGVTRNLADLLGSGEPGALDEATSDIFGTMIEFYAANPNDPGDYVIAEEIKDAGVDQPIRYMYHPGRDLFSFTCWSVIPPDWPFVHYASGVGNHFFFNLAEGSGETPYGFSPLCGNAKPVTGIGRDAAARIWFKALDEYFISNTGYVNPDNPANTARAYTLKAARDLYGWCSPQVKAVHAAWLSVGVAGNLICDKLQLDLDHLTVFTGEAAAVTILTHADPDAKPITLQFSASGLPEGTEATFEPREVQAGDKAAMVVRVPAFARPGTYEVTITATSKEGSESVTLQLTVVAKK